MENTKCCSKCQEVKSVEEFNKNARSKDGLRSECKACSKASRERAKARKNAEAVVEELDFDALLQAEEQDNMNMFMAEAQMSEPVAIEEAVIEEVAVTEEEAIIDEAIQMTEEVAALLQEVKHYNLNGKDIVKAIELRKAIQNKIGKVAKNVKKVFDENEVMHFEDKAMKEVFGKDWKPSRHGYIVLDLNQAVEFVEKHNIH